MAANCKLAQQQEKTATDLWKASETQKTKLEQQLRGMGHTVALTLPPLTSNPQEASTQTELANCIELVDIATQTDPTSPRDQTMVSAQTEEDISTTIRNYEEDIALHKAFADKAKERQIGGRENKGADRKKGSRTTETAPRSNGPALGGRTQCCNIS